MGNILTEEWSLYKCAVFVFIFAWFVGWAAAAKHMMMRTEVQRQDLVRVAAQEIQMQKQKLAKQSSADNKKSR